jgi:hypothetical protein
MKLRTKAFILGLAIFFALTPVVLAQSQQLAWDGTHWKEFPMEVKVAYIKGVGNMASFENSVGGAGKAPCISRSFVEELKGKTIAQVVADVDKYYADNPAKVKTPVIEVILRQSTKICAPGATAMEKKK